MSTHVLSARHDTLAATLLIDVTFSAIKDNSLTVLSTNALIYALIILLVISQRGNALQYAHNHRKHSQILLLFFA